MSEQMPQNVQGGDEIGPLKLIKILGDPGEQGAVWLASMTDQPELQYAVKVSPYSLRSHNKNAHERFAKEFNTIAKMRHPNIVRGYWKGTFLKEKEEYPYYVMEYREGSVPLHKCELLDNPIQRRYICLKAFFDIVSALKHLHLDKSGYHLDLKPSNILVQMKALDSINVTLIDFGFSDFLTADGKLDEAAAAGRLATKTTSLHRSRRTKTYQHCDLWQLCRSIKDLLDKCTTPAGQDDHTHWPIDYALYDATYNLIEEWSSDDVNSAPDDGFVGDFYEKIDQLKSSICTNGLADDIRPAARFINIPEIATVAKVVSADHAIRIPQRQLVLYTDRVKRLLASSTMSALCHTRQLGFTHLVYPGAQGTRFEHSVGVYDLACHFVLRMSGKPEFRRVCRSPKDALLFVLAALLHDIGHFPYAHQLEEFEASEFAVPQQLTVNAIIGKQNGHHKRGQQLIKTGEIRKLLETEFQLTGIDIDRLCLFIEKPTNEQNPDAALLFLRSVLNGPMDLDKLDYIERDANHCGVPYGNYVDTERIFETMRVYEKEGTAMLAFDERGVGSLEQLAVARHQLYTNVYWHRAVRSATAMFKHLFYLYQQIFPNADSLKDMFFEAGSDERLLLEMEKQLKLRSEKKDEKEQMIKAALHLAQAVSGGKRALYKAIVQCKHDENIAKFYGESSYERQRMTAKKIYDRLSEKSIWDLSADTLGEHNVLIDCRFDSWPPFGSIKILDTKGGKPKSLEVYSPLITKLNDTFRRQACKIRVFVNVDALKAQYKTKTDRAELERLIRAEVGDTGDEPAE